MYTCLAPLDNESIAKAPLPAKASKINLFFKIVSFKSEYRILKIDFLINELVGLTIF